MNTQNTLPSRFLSERHLKAIVFAWVSRRPVLCVHPEKKHVASS
jgi:hypothetical protein